MSFPHLWIDIDKNRDELFIRTSLFILHNQVMKDLIRRIKANDEDAFKQLLDLHHRMIYKIIYSFKLSNGDYRIDEKDLYQEGCLALYNAVFSYEEDRNVKFSSYAYIAIRSGILNSFRKYSRTYNEENVSLDLISDHSLPFRIQENPAQYHKEKEFRRELKQFIADLSKEDQKIITMKQDDSSYQQIADDLGINVKRVDNRLCNIRKRLRKHLNESIE